jgi:hypothetical protein
MQSLSTGSANSFNTNKYAMATGVSELGFLNIPGQGLSTNNGGLYSRYGVQYG